MRRFSKVGLGAVTAATMATSTFAIIVASVLAPQWIDEFQITRAQLGLVTTVIGLVGAFASPVFGHITDRIGAVPSMIGALVCGGVGLTGLAVSPAFSFLVAAAVICGTANGWGNPATNSVIVDNVPAGGRGFVTGVKQSGVQMGSFLGGLLLPIFTIWWSWRVAVLAFLLIPLGGLVGEQLLRIGLCLTATSAWSHPTPSSRRDFVAFARRWTSPRHSTTRCWPRRPRPDPTLPSMISGMCPS